MFVLITYDVNITSPNGAKRLRNVAKACIDFGKRVQNSVFECILTEAQLVMLRNKLNPNRSLGFLCVVRQREIL